MEILINQTRLTLVQGDITGQTTDAIVNAANSSLMDGGGVDGAIHRAGGLIILEECKRIVSAQGRLPAGKAVITGGGNLPAKYVIHMVGPVWHGGTGNELKLWQAPIKKVSIAQDKKLTRISFPSISTGAYGYPVNQEAKVAIKTVISFLEEEAVSFKEVRFVLFDSGTYEAYLALQDKI